MRATCRAELLLVALVVSTASPGCASGRATGPDAARRDSGIVLMLDTGPTGLDAGAFPDTPSIDAPRPDAGERPDAPIAPGTDAGPTIVRDTGVDAPIPVGTDAGPPPECFTAADCSDADPCNGIERCEFGMCTPGIAVTCDDGVACTNDTCSGGSCVYTPNDAVCGTGMRCTASGCMSTTSCSETPCRLASPQCGCGPGQACTLSGTSRACVTAGTIPEGASCSGGASDCTAGNVCVNFGPTTPINACAHFCAMDTECSGGLCIGQLNDGTGAPIPGALICTRVCDPVGQTGCAAGLECTLFQERAGARRIYRDCTASLGSGGVFSPCASEDECAPGYTCVDLGVGFGPECAHWCNVGTGVGCGGLGSCLGYTTPLIVGGVEYGVCG